MKSLSFFLILIFFSCSDEKKLNSSDLDDMVSSYNTMPIDEKAYDLSIPQGIFQYELFFAEHGGRLSNESCKVQITKKQIVVSVKEEVIFEGILVEHISGKWILADKLEDKNAKEIGGCTMFPIIHFGEKIIEWC